MSKVTERTSLLLINSLFTSLYGGDWWRLEDETLSLDLNLEFSPLMLAKVRLLKGMLSDSRPLEERLLDENTEGVMDIVSDRPRIEEDPVLFMAANDVVNNQDPNGKVALMPTVLELGYTLYVLCRLPIQFTPGLMTKKLCEEVLHQEGILCPFFPFVEFHNFPDASQPHAAQQERHLREALGLYILDMEAA